MNRRITGALLALAFMLAACPAAFAQDGLEVEYTQLKYGDKLSYTMLGIEGRTAYCYNRDKPYPPHGGTLRYEREDFFGQNGYEGIARQMECLLLAGYPVDAFGLMEKYDLAGEGEGMQISDEQLYVCAVAHSLTQQALWLLMHQADSGAAANLAPRERSYVEELLHIAQNSIYPTFPCNMTLNGSLSFSGKDGVYETGLVSIEGVGGDIRITVPDYMTVRDESDAQRYYVSAGEKFYIQSVRRPQADAVISAAAYCTDGGDVRYYQSSQSEYQNLISVAVTQKQVELSLDWSVGTDEDDILLVPDTGAQSFCPAACILAGASALLLCRKKRLREF